MRPLPPVGFGDAVLLQSLEERIETIADETRTAAAAEVDGTITTLRAGLDDNRAEIYDEIARISRLREDAAGLQESVVSSRSMALLPLCAATVAA